MGGGGFADPVSSGRPVGASLRSTRTGMVRCVLEAVAADRMDESLAIGTQPDDTPDRCRCSVSVVSPSAGQSSIGNQLDALDCF